MKSSAEKSVRENATRFCANSMEKIAAERPSRGSVSYSENKIFRDDVALSEWRRFLFLLVCGFAWLLGSSGAAPAAEAGSLGDLTLRQIEALQQEKTARSPAQRKMDSQLVYEAKRHRNEAIASAASALQPDVTVPGDGRVLVDIVATVSPALLAEIGQGGGTVLSSFATENAIRAWVPIQRIESLAGRVDVRFIRPAAQAMTHRYLMKENAAGAPAALPRPNGNGALLNIGSVSSQGDTTHRAAAARATFGVSGTGVKVGVLSDSVDYLSLSQSSGDLGPVTILPGQAGSGTGEGTAMLEIIHDLAPGAQLYFASAFLGEASFAQNIRDLQAAGCKIIVDDVGYFDEPPFQDGIIARAVNDVSAAGTLYFSSAANSGNKNDGTSGTWEGDFTDGGPATLGRGGRLHDFGGATFDTVLSSGYGAYLFWADPLGGSTNDYDLYVMDSGGFVVRSSTNIQDGNDDPLESLSANSGERIVIVKYSGAARFLHLDTFRGQLSLSTSGNTHGHNASGAANAFCVAATDAGNSYPSAFSGGNFNPVETFSSDGLRRIFFSSNGAALTPGNFTATGGQLLQKPDLTAADGVATATPGFSSFYGTSASAPHAAAIAALLLSYNPSLTPAQVRAAMSSTALDIEAAGVDRDSGAGIVMAFEALQAAPPPAPRILVEAESGTLSGSMAAFSDPFASQGRYIMAGTIPGAASIPVSLPAAGQYVVWGRVLATASNRDSFNVSVDGGTVDVYDVAENSWTNRWQWSRVNGRNGGNPLTINPRLFTLGAGTHTFLFQARDTFTQLDRLIVTTDLNFNPSNNYPIIAVQPVSQTVATGSNVLFNVDALGTAPLAYQWMFNHTNLSGATNKMLALSNAQTNQSGIYSVLVGDSYGSVFSSDATLQVFNLGTNFFDDFEPGIKILQWSAFSGTVLANTNGGSVSGSNSLWFGGDTARSAATRSLNTSIGGVIQFYLRLGSALFPWEQVDLPAEGIVLEYSLDNGSAWTFIASYDTANYTNWTFRSLDIPPAAQSANTRFRWRQLEHSGTCCDHWALDNAEVTMGPRPPTITTQPISQAMVVGGAVSFSVQAGGSSPLSYQWRKNGSVLPGATASVYDLSNVQSNHAGTYSVVVSNLYGSATSSNASLSIVPISAAVGVFDDSTYVDTVGGPYSESDNVQASIQNLGFVPLPFTNITAAAGTYSKLLFPKLELRDLSFDLTVGARTALSNFVSSGGSLIVHGSGTSGGRLLNAVLNLSVVENWPSGNYPTFTRSAAVAGTEFGDDPATLPNNSACSTLLSSSLPTTARSLYTSNDQAVVMLLEWGNGRVIYLGWDWFDAAPTGSQDNGWLTVLSSAIRQGPLPPSAPGIILQPQSSTIRVGTTASFSVSAFGTAPLSYQWQKNGFNLVGATNASYTRFDAQTSDSGSYRVVVSNPYGSVASSAAALTVLDLPQTEFQILALTTNHSRVVDHDTLTGDDRGGIAASLSQILYSGDNSTARFALSDLSGGTALGRIFDALFGDLKTGKIYSLANGATPLTFSGGTANTLLEHDGTTGKLNGNSISLSTPITLLNGNNVGIFAGYGRVVLHTGTRVYDIDLPSGVVLELGAMPTLAHVYTESWAYWGVAEYFNGMLHLAYVQNSQNIVRTAVPSGVTTTLAGFSNLSDMAAFTVSVPLGRWYFHHEGSSQFGGFSETLGYADALFSINEPVLRVVRASTVDSCDGMAILPIHLVSPGGENALGFSLNFDPALLSNPQVSLGAGTSGASLVVNANQALAGRLGLALSLPPGARFSAGSTELVTVRFTVSALSNNIITALSFGDVPIAREVVDASAQDLPATFAHGNITIYAGYEADVAARPTGNGRLTVADWVQVGRFFAGLDTLGDANEFQRADCAPRASCGDGVLSILDWVQAGRYAAALDAPKGTGGPRTPALQAGFAATVPQTSAARIVHVLDATATGGTTNTITVELVAEGAENALSFSVSFDRAWLQFVGATLGRGASGAKLLVNTSQAATGKVGIALALGAGSTFPAGTQQIVRIQFATAFVAASVTTPLTFSGQPIARQISDSQAQPIPGNYFNGNLTITVPPHALRLTTPFLSASNTLGLTIGNFDGSPVTTERLSKIKIRATTNLAQSLTNWTQVTNSLTLSNGLIRVDQLNSTNPPLRFFRATEEP